MEEWKEYRLSDFMEFNPKISLKKETVARKITMDQLVPHSRDIYSWTYEPYSGGAKFQNGDTIMARITPCLENGKHAFISLLDENEIAYGSTEYIVIRGRKGISDNLFVYYLTHFPSFKDAAIKSMVGTSGRQRAQVDVLENLTMKLPSIAEQKSIADILTKLDDKIAVNKQINDNFYLACLEVILIWLLTSLENDNLEKQAMALFDMMFPAVASGEDVIGNVIIPKRGKGLLSKDAVEGNVPVVAGGLEPATYHNESNTVAPVVTISASGANAGFVNLWQIPVWSSDSSFIDASMTENVYFWYVMLKKRQKEIFDAQTGSAQPHIYPKHIAEMPMGNFEHSDVEKFTEIVTPMFEIRGRNLKESERLSSIRDSLLPKLMSGELKLNEVNV